MLEREFIERTNSIVRLLVDATGRENITGAARIITKQANMDYEGLLEECNDLIRKIKRGKMELLSLRWELNGNKDCDGKNTDDED